ncbi:fungal-specific transcription factor domain-containing protein, partial [Lasiosphaeria ovina]
KEGNKSAKSGRQNPGPACQHCRMRKFRCDRQRPCGGCVDAGLRCRFDSTPPQKGPKKGHLKLLRSRIGKQLPVNDNKQERDRDLTLHHALDKELSWPSSPGQRDQLYFDRVHVFIPILHRRRYFARGRPGAGASASYACLQAAIRTLAAALSSQFNHLRHDLYHDTLRRLNHPASCAPGGGSAEDDETRRLELAQAWILVAIYEFMQGTVQRAWTSAGLAIRIVQLMRLHDVDGGAAPAHLDMGADDPNAFVDKEVKRRVFWVAFCLDRFSCVLEKLPLTLDEKTILTRLPCPEQAFQSQTPVTMPFLSDLDAAPDSISLQSPFVDSIVFTAIWGRALCHQQQCAAESARGSPTAEVCRRHVQLHDLLSCRMLHFERSYTAASVEADSLLLFTSMVAQVSVLAL